MATEIERKFLLKDNTWRKLHSRKEDIIQGYLANTERGSIRIRLTGDKANFNIKSMTLGVTRQEYEYPLPADEAKSILYEMCMRPLIEKTRYYVEYEGHTWEIDEFYGDNKGLIVAELELKSAEESYKKPEWIGEEVSDDPRYYNVCLIEHPYFSWEIDTPD